MSSRRDNKSDKGLGRQILKNTSQEVAENKSKGPYSRFAEINGWHPWQDAMPGSYISYPVRRIAGSVAYFNFQLAKEMGLISPSHPEKLNEELEEKILDTFSLQIINEYDQLHRRNFRRKDIKENEYMATRYLQLQHADKTGKTSGDGRSIWNGVIEHNGTTWDVSSRGTGVTALAPGSVESDEPLKSGSEEVGYGCGMAENDELFASAILAEIFHNHSINTERVLAIVDLGKGLGIGVRAAPNLMRPAHFFGYLKQGEVQPLRQALDYMIQRQYKNGTWSFSSRHPRKYRLMLDTVCQSFARFAATLDVDYIFAWLDWDGDNVLVDAGIIDYGSIRQFGLRHDQYRYDDVARFSTNLNEQKLKTKLTVQVFAQAIDFALSGKKKPLKNFENHQAVQQFQNYFEYYRLLRILFRTGFDEANCKRLLADERGLVEDFAREYDFIERRKVSEKTIEVSDGVNRPALYNIRNLLRELPGRLLSAQNFESFFISSKEFYETLYAEGTKEEDKKISQTLETHAKNFQILYKNLIRKTKRRRSIKRTLENMNERSAKINHADRITGNGIVNIIEEILKAKRSGFSTQDIHSVIHKFIANQCLDPDNPYHRKRVQFERKKAAEKLLSTVFSVVREHNEDL